MKDRPIKIRDRRRKQYFTIDDEYLNGYARYLGATASMVYISLCRHASKQQQAYPSQKLIAEELGINERIVSQKIRLLEQARLISIDKVKRKDGTWLNNLYTLLDKTEWRKPTYINYVAGVKKIIQPKKAEKTIQKTKSPTTKKGQKHPQPPTGIMYINQTHISNQTHINSASAENKNIIENLGDILKRKLLPKTTNTYSWQEAAERHYNNLNLAGQAPARWYKIFKEDQQRAEQAAYWVKDANARNPEKLTYWKYNKLSTRTKKEKKTRTKSGRGGREGRNTHYRTPPEVITYTPDRGGERPPKIHQSKKTKKR